MTQINQDYVEFNPEALFSIQLIPDEREYKEQMIDHHLAWLAENDPTNRLKTPSMVKDDAEIQYFQNRNHELKQECEWKVHQRLFQHEREVNKIQNTDPPVSEVGREHEVEARKKQWIEQEIVKREEVCDREVKLILARYNTLMRQCEERITQATSRYQEAYHRWQQENKGGNLGGAA
ncbi:MAG: hypothetical protein KME08_10895 [Aphanothece sp. CMT-3BRIN-NPC111]|jgi:hypothetical protein|nr:hypothetical protein [Aphanothece sp. CMT-3BRIN-NPC111]